MADDLKLPPPPTVREVLLWLVRGDKRKAGRVYATSREAVDRALLITRVTRKIKRQR